MVTPEDMMMASKLVTVSPGYLSKWTKADLTSAALALKLFVHELPGGPKLLHRAAELATTSSSTGGDGEDDGMLRAVEAIRCQEGVDASLYRPAQSAGDAAATSTQKQDGMGLSWAEISASQIPSGQGEGNGNGPSFKSSSSSSIDNGGSVISGKVSDNNTNGYVCYANPPPHDRAPRADVKGPREGGVDAVASGRVVARGAGVGGVDVDGGDKTKKKGSTTTVAARGAHTSTEERPRRICNRTWKGKKCNKENNGCNFPHPAICADSRCGGEAMRDCTAFHPPSRARAETRAAGNGGGGARQGSGTTHRRKPKKAANSGNGNHRPNRNNSSRPTYTQLQERLAAMKLERSRERGIREEIRELKGLANPERTERKGHLVSS